MLNQMTIPKFVSDVFGQKGTSEDGPPIFLVS